MNLEELKKIISLEEKEGYYPHLPIKAGIFLHCKEEKQDIFLDFIDKNWENSELTYTTFEREFLKGIVDILEKESRTVDEENNPAAEVKKNIEKKYPKKKFSVYDKIVGIKVENKEEFGKFTIYNIEENIDILEEEIKEEISVELKEKILEIKENKYLIKVKVEARELNKAYELAKEENKKFINLLFIEDFKGKFIYIKPLKISIMEEPVDNPFIKRVGIAENQVFFIDERKIPFRIKDYTKEKRDKNCENLWKIISNEKSNELEMVIKNSIKWLGEAIQEKDIATSFLKAMIVLEGILKEVTEWKYVSKNIYNRTAIILKKEYNILNTVAEMKVLYNLRCEIAHRGKVEIDNKDRIILINYVKKVLITLTTDNDYKNIQDMKGLVKKLKKECRSHNLK